MFSKGGLLELLESSSYFKVTKIRTHIWPVWPSYTLSYNALLHIQVIHTFPPPGYLKTFCATICKLPSAAFPITKGELFFYQKVCAQWSQFPGTPSTSLGNSLTPSIPGQGKMTRRDAHMGRLTVRWQSAVCCRYEIGEGLYIGWCSAVLAIAGGAILTCSCKMGTKEK